MKYFSILLVTAFVLLLFASCGKNDPEEPAPPLLAEHYAILEAMPQPMLSEAINTSTDSVAEVIAFSKIEVDKFLNTISGYYLPKEDAVRTTIEVEVVYAESRLAERNFLVFYWNNDDNRLVRQLSAEQENPRQYYLELFQRTPLSGEAYLPEIRAWFNAEFTTVTTELHSSYALSDIVYTEVAEELSWQPTEDGSGWSFDYSKPGGKAFALVIQADGGGSLNQLFQGKTLYAEWNDRGEGDWDISRDGQTIKTGSF